MADDQTEADSPLAGLFAALQARWRVFAAAGVLAALAWGGSQLWRAVGARVAADPRYRITAESIETTPPPAWVRRDIRAEVLAGDQLSGGVSSLSPPAELEARLADAFQRHPWVRSVGRMTKQPPNRIQLELNYRVPLAAIGAVGRPGGLLLADSEAARLPAGDLTEAELRHLPRITLPRDGVPTSLPPLGQPWPDQQVRGAVAIVGLLGQTWWELGLADILPSKVGQGHSFNYELVSNSGTRVMWGASPLATPAGEPSPADKLAWLTTYVRNRGPLTDARIDLRTPRPRIVPQIGKKEDTDDLLK